MMYEFSMTDGLVFTTSFSPRELTKFYCFDAFDREGNRIVILTENVDFKSFQYNQ
jgi:hypothetical protein